MSKLFYALFLVCYISGCKSPDDVLDKVCSIPDSYFVDKCGNLNACVNWSNYKNTRRYGVGRCKTMALQA